MEEDVASVHGREALHAALAALHAAHGASLEHVLRRCFDDLELRYLRLQHPMHNAQARAPREGSGDDQPQCEGPAAAAGPKAQACSAEGESLAALPCPKD